MSQVSQLSQLEPPSAREVYLSALTEQPVTVMVVFSDASGRTTVVRPLGRGVRAEGCPRTAARDGLARRLGLYVELGRLLATDRVAGPRSAVTFVYDGGCLSDLRFEAIALSASCPVPAHLLDCYVRARETGQTALLANGRPVDLAEVPPVVDVVESPESVVVSLAEPDQPAAENVVQLVGAGRTTAEGRERSGSFRWPRHGGESRTVTTLHRDRPARRGPRILLGAGPAGWSLAAPSPRQHPGD